MTNEKITEREIYGSILDDSFDIDVLKEFAEKKIAQLDKRNESAKARAAKKRAEGDALQAAVLDLITDELQTRAQITAAYNAEAEEPLSEAKIGARLNALVKAETIRKEQVKVSGEDGKSKTVMAYALA